MLWRSRLKLTEVSNLISGAQVTSSWRPTVATWPRLRLWECRRIQQLLLKLLAASMLLHPANGISFQLELRDRQLVACWMEAN